MEPVHQFAKPRHPKRYPRSRQRSWQPEDLWRFKQTYMDHPTSLWASWVPTALTGKKARQVVMIALYYKEAILGSRVNFPPRIIKDSKVIASTTPVASKQVMIPIELAIQVAIPMYEVAKPTTIKEALHMFRRARSENQQSFLHHNLSRH